MRLKGVEYVLRKDGYFHLKDRRVKAVHGGDGYGVDLVFEVSPLDVDFGLDPGLYDKLKGEDLHFFVTYQQFEEIGRKLKESDEKTWRLRGGKGWPGKHSFFKVHEFM